MFRVDRGTLLVAFVLCAHLALGAPPARGDDSKVTPLFQSDQQLDIRIEAPFGTLIRKARNSTDAYEGKLSIIGAGAEEFPILLSARGLSRRNPDNCDFPPLRVKLKSKPGDQSLFKGQSTLKLVTHCKSPSNYQQYNLLEYTVYRLFNLLTPYSFRVRLAHIDYIETGSSKPRVSRLGFFIEDVDDLAKRHKLKEMKVESTKPSQLNPSAAALVGLFEYMIGNLDWAVLSGPKGSDCCHNVKLLGKTSDASSDITPVPYDFDYSGFVNTPYAAPPEGIPVHSVRTRYYRGFCAFNAETMEAAQAILAKRTNLLAIVEATPSLSDSKKRSASKYLEQFFKEISDPDVLDQRILRKCRN